MPISPLVKRKIKWPLHKPREKTTSRITSADPTAGRVARDKLSYHKDEVYTLYKLLSCITFHTLSKSLYTVYDFECVCMLYYNCLGHLGVRGKSWIATTITHCPNSQGWVSGFLLVI